MTEIREYRGKRLDNGEWVYGYAMPHDDNAVTMFRQHPMDGSLQGFEVDPETVGRWSGERNFEGNKIYNGDYIETWDTIILIREVRGGGLAPFRQTKNGFTRMTNWDHAIHGKIIGTIHDNPELKGGE